MQLSSRAHRNISVNYETIFDEAFVKLHIKTMAFAHDVTRKSLRQIDTATATTKNSCVYNVMTSTK